jgi:hypothetical protein
MDAKVDAIMQKTAEYIETTQTLLDKHNENRTAFLKRANQVAGVLANKGIITRDKVDAFVDKVAADETGTEVWNLIEKLADCLPVDDLGSAASEKLAEASNLDPFEKLALYGDARADVSGSGEIE